MSHLAFQADLARLCLYKRLGNREAQTKTRDAGGVPMDLGGAASASGASQTQSSRANTGSGVIAQVPSGLVEAVIQSLQQKIAA